MHPKVVSVGITQRICCCFPKPENQATHLAVSINGCAPNEMNIDDFPEKNVHVGSLWMVCGKTSWISQVPGNLWTPRWLKPQPRLVNCRPPPKLARARLSGSSQKRPRLRSPLLLLRSKSKNQHQRAKSSSIGCFLGFRCSKSKPNP